MGLFGNTRKTIGAHDARIYALEERAAAFDDMLRTVETRAEDHARDLEMVTEGVRQLSARIDVAMDGVERMIGGGSIAAELRNHREMLVRLRNDLVKLRVDVEQQSAEADTQTRALFMRIEAVRQ